MKNTIQYAVSLFTNKPVEKISLKPQLSVISTDLALREPGMISANF
jgi:hypothetical protein